MDKSKLKNGKNCVEENTSTDLPKNKKWEAAITFLNNKVVSIRNIKP